MAGVQNRALRLQRPRPAAALAFLVCALVGLIVVASAGSKVTNRARVGVNGRNATHGYSSQLFVDLVSPSSYDAGCCTDVDSGEWNGPEYAATLDPNLRGTASISWSVIFDRTAQSASSAAHNRLIHKWPAEPAVALGVPLVVKGFRVGVLPAVGWITEEPGANSAQVEGDVGFRLCRGLYAVADFDALKPDANRTNGVAGDYSINNSRPSDWNRAAVVASLQGVILDGYLPPGRLGAIGGSRAITGKLTDCAGHPMPFAAVSAAGNRVHTNRSGHYRLPVRPGVYTVVARAGGLKIARDRVRVH